MSESDGSSDNQRFKNLVVPGSMRQREGGSVLVGTECQECGFVVFPTRTFCRDCLSENVREVDLSRRGTLKTYTEAHTGQFGFEPPYAFSFVSLPEEVQLYSLLTDYGDIDDLQLGMTVELTLDVIRMDESGDPLYGHKFKPIPEAEQ